MHNAKHMQIHSGTFSSRAGLELGFSAERRTDVVQFIPKTKHADDRAPPDKHNADILTKHCCLFSNKQAFSPHRTHAADILIFYSKTSLKNKDSHVRWVSVFAVFILQL